jgi:hypothetical protein
MVNIIIPLRKSIILFKLTYRDAWIEIYVQGNIYKFSGNYLISRALKRRLKVPWKHLFAVG